MEFFGRIEATFGYVLRGMARWLLEDWDESHKNLMLVPIHHEPFAHFPAGPAQQSSPDAVAVPGQVHPASEK